MVRRPAGAGLQESRARGSTGGGGGAGRAAGTGRPRPGPSQITCRGEESEEPRGPAGEEQRLLPGSRGQGCGR